MRRQQGWCKGIVLVVLAAGLSVAQTLPADEPETAEQAREQLQATEAEIEQLREVLKGLEQEMTGLQQELQESESDIGRLERESRELEQQIEDGEARLQELRRDSQALQLALEAQHEQIARQARAAYMAGDQDYLKVLLNQDDPARMSRMLGYYQQVSQARVRELDEYRTTLRQISDTREAMLRQQQSLQGDRSELEQRTASLQEQQRQRSRLLTQLRQQQGSQTQQLENQQAERKALNELIERLDQAITSIPTPAGSLPFADAKGKLPLPVTGEIKARFGSQRGGDERLRWDGLLLDAEEGSPVHAIHGGRVVFAEWLRGSGLLLILDHGQGYLSLYGHNQSLLHDVGTWVQPGEAVATVGNSGGQAVAGLYFAIRHQGRPLDPLGWCMLSS
ncbi:murein hydrolase activator EnvC family protein [Halopseudomonas salegens]|uniref:Septal ring factor EnvC, activator of murein hydrolases AmiA and AmiB n=1 Tax=Halopseudomonas salegens TaxID=1434072 RepID=A0A1H2E3R8_9GAMM|nr:peptidoglycan DD-metalloendopeptidase family protein [Halopseudomonas salegens]SDT89649.1 Septal ring factor EnvC, activator of murein hydrolases AmiA and AmiB [Halopseudomonas salegens]